MNPILSIHAWVSLPSEVRNRVRTLFSIPRSSNTVVHDGRIETDGTTVEDFGHLTVEKMKAYLSSESSDFHLLFGQVVQKVSDEISGITREVPKTEEPAAAESKEAKKKNK